MVLRASWLLVALLASASPDDSGVATSKVGMARRKLTPIEPYAWRGSREHTLAVTVWYPAAVTAHETAITVPAVRPMWLGGSAAPDAAPLPNKKGYPLIVLSHGTGGAGMQLAWLGTALARRGFIAAAVNHPGNSYEDTSTFEGTVFRWQRARDLSAVVDGLLADKTLGPLVDATRIGAAGFSLGGYTVIELAGGRTDVFGLRDYCAAHPGTCPAPPPEYANLNEAIATKAHSSPEFRAELAKAGDSYRDARVRAVFAMAPAVGHSVTAASLATISIPVQIVVGDGDRLAPASGNAAYYAEHIAKVRLEILHGGVGHFVFLDLSTPTGKATLPYLAVDGEGVDRSAVHARVSDMAAAFFSGVLK